VQRRCNNIESQRSMLWNYGPKCLLEAGYHDLSMPKVDTTYLIGQWPDHLQEGSPLFNVCHRVYEAEDTHPTYGNRGNWSDKPPVEKAVSLLSRAALREMHRYREIAEVCFNLDHIRNIIHLAERNLLTDIILPDHCRRRARKLSRSLLSIRMAARFEGKMQEPSHQCRGIPSG
jgi:hypothetical protein